MLQLIGQEKYDFFFEKFYEYCESILVWPVAKW
jgi:hypothetical protein